MFWQSEKDDLRELFPIENLPMEVFSSQNRDALSLIYRKWEDSSANTAGKRLPMRMHGKDPDKAAFLKKMLPVLDGFDNVLKYARVQHAKGEEVLHNWMKSLESIHRRLISTLQDEGLVVVESIGKPLDLTIHEVVESREVTGVRHNYVIEEIAKGYKCGNRVLRDAQVVVAKNPDNIGVGTHTLDEQELPDQLRFDEGAPENGINPVDNQ